MIRGGSLPNGCPQMPNMFRFWTIFRALPFLAPPYPLLYLHSLPLPLPSFISPHPFPSLPKEVNMNKKLSYRRLNVLGIIKTRTQYRKRTCTVFIRTLVYCRLAGRVMFSTCPVVRPSVRPFVRLSVVCYQLVNASKTSKTNDLI